ncbi:MAG TPA: carboxypeptidase-like regulatory domain-containing protein [Planctomycetota bacterium]|nr:carboxypeptidase-like regulatory domain-containing protein [Planctomycetota bacterium]
MGKFVVAALAILLLVAGAWFMGLLDQGDTTNSDPLSETGQNARQSPAPIPQTPEEGARPIEVKPFVSPVQPAPAEATAKTGAGLHVRVILSGLGLPEVPLFLHRDHAPEGRIHQLGDLVATGATNADGEFTFSPIPDRERMILRVSHPEHENVEIRGISSLQPSSLKQVVELTAGFAIEGTVRHAQGFPVNGVTVKAYDLQVQAFNPEDQLERAAVTDDEGRYRLSGMKAGMKQLVAYHPDLKTEFGKTSHFKKETKEQNFTMSEGVSVSGVVRNRLTGDLIPKAKVMGRIAGAQAGTGLGQRVLECECDEEGRFVLPGLGRGTYEFWARHDHYLVGSRATVSAPLDGLGLDLVPGGEVFGVVRDGATGKLVTNGAVYLTSNPSIVMPTRAYHRTLGPDGAFHFYGVPEGSMHLVARVPGFAEATQGPLTIYAGTKLSDVVIDLGQGTAVVGKVMSEASLPVAGAEVRITRDLASSGDAMAAFLGPLMRESASTMKATTDAQGNYRAVGLTEGRFTIEVAHPDFAARESGSIVVPAGATEVQANAVILVQAGGIAGIVLTDGSPDSKARVSIIGSNGKPATPEVATDGNGRFQVKGLMPGTYTLRVTQRRGAVDLGSILFQAADTNPERCQVLAGSVTEVELKDRGNK